MAERSKNVVEAISDYGTGLFNFIRGKVSSEADAEDILQDVWCRLSTVPDAGGIEEMRGWLYKVARNRIIDKSRKRSEDLIEDMANGVDDDDDGYNFSDILLSDDDDPESVYIKELFWDELFAALDELPANQKKVFVENELEDKTLQQIADETGEKLKTVISRKGYAVKYLRKRLEILYNEFLDY